MVYLVEAEVPNAGCFWDMFSMLACMFSKRQQGKDKVNESYSAKHIQSKHLANHLMAALSHDCLDVLYAKKADSELGALEDQFVAVQLTGTWIKGTEESSKGKSQITSRLVFTGNSTAEAAFWKGTLRSAPLF